MARYSHHAVESACNGDSQGHQICQRVQQSQLLRVVSAWILPLADVFEVIKCRTRTEIHASCTTVGRDRPSRSCRGLRKMEESLAARTSHGAWYARRSGVDPAGSDGVRKVATHSIPCFVASSSPTDRDTYARRCSAQCRPVRRTSKYSKRQTARLS